MKPELGFGSLKCWRLQECGLAGTVSASDCEDACIEEALEALPGDPCWAEWIEVRRCGVLEAACEGVEQEEPAPGATGACVQRQERLDTCES